MFASGKYALGICDRCGFTEKLNDLRYETVNMKQTRMKVCDDCFDPDHPQLHLGRVRINDPQALRDPRPDSSTEVSHGDEIVLGEGILGEDELG